MRHSLFVEIKPLNIQGQPFEVSQIKTESGNLIHLDIRLRNTPSDDSFVIINCRGTGGINATDILYNSIWQNKYTFGFIDADFLHFSGNDKSNFIEDKELKEFIKTVEEKVESKLAETINKIASKRKEEIIQKMYQNLEFALSKTLRSLSIDLEGTKTRTKKCPKCGKIVSYNQQVCPDCKYKWPKSTKKCKFCHKIIPSYVQMCPKCGKDLVKIMRCPECGAEVSKFSYKCPKCNKQLREPPNPPKGKSPPIYPNSPGPHNPRSSIDTDENGKLKGILINQDHLDYNIARLNNFEQLYISTLASREVAKYQFGKEKNDYSEDMMDILFNMFKSLIEIGSVKYNESVK